MLLVCATITINMPYGPLFFIQLRQDKTEEGYFFLFLSWKEVCEEIEDVSKIKWHKKRDTWLDFRTNSNMLGEVLYRSQICQHQATVSDVAYYDSGKTKMFCY